MKADTNTVISENTMTDQELWGQLLTMDFDLEAVRFLNKNAISKERLQNLLEGTSFAEENPNLVRNLLNHSEFHTNIEK